jgi:uncharacterized protein YdhG (YjbR/CyaY superfamily)
MATSGTGKDDGFTAAERAAMKERARELKAEAKREATRASGEADIEAKLADMPEDDRALASALHVLITSAAPHLMPRTWYGMPAYAKDGKVLCFVQVGSKFDSRYTTLGFNDVAALDDGAMWPTAYAVTDLGPAQRTFITELVQRAAS